MTQIKTSFGAALLFLSRPAQLHSNIFQKEKGPCSLEMYKLISSRHQSEFWVTRSSRKKKKKKQWYIHFKKLEIDCESVVLLSWGFGVQTWHTLEKKKQKKKTLFCQMKPRRALKACVTAREQTVSCSHTVISPSARWFCDKYKLISLEWIISVHVHLHLNFNQLQHVPWACSAHMIINMALGREDPVEGVGRAKCAF